jgi:hypothetical protein
MNPSRHSKDVSDDLWSIDSDHDRMQILQMRVTQLLLSQQEAFRVVEHAVLELQERDQREAEQEQIKYTQEEGRPAGGSTGPTTISFRHEAHSSITTSSPYQRPLLQDSAPRQRGQHILQLQDTPASLLSAPIINSGDSHETHLSQHNNLDDHRWTAQSLEKPVAGSCNYNGLDRRDQELMPIPKDLLPPERRSKQAPRRKSL